MAAAGKRAREVGGEGFGFLVGTVENVNGCAIGGQAGDDGSGGSACADDGDVFFFERGSLVVPGAGESVRVRRRSRSSGLGAWHREIG